MNYAIVGYTTRPVADVARFLPAAYEAAGIAAKTEADDLRLTADLGRRPYTSVLDRIAIIGPGAECRRAWTANPSRPDLSIAVQAGLFLNSAFPKAWLVGAPPEDQMTFVGFDPARFLQLMALEASMPRFERPLPVRMWRDAKCIDVAAAVSPPEASHLSLVEIAALRTPTVAEAAAKWTGWLEKWTGPGVDPNLDTWLATELAAQLGLFDG